MNEHTMEPGQRALEERTRSLFRDSVDNLDMGLRSRLTQARYAALAAADHSGHRNGYRFSVRGWFTRGSLWTPAAGVMAAAMLGMALWFGTPLGHHGASGSNGVMSADNQSNFEDLDIVAASDEGSGDAMEMLQDDIDFYDWADKAASSEPAAS
jgi:hypothetical protein